MTEFHPLLLRQLRRIGHGEAPEPPTREQWADLLERVDRAYTDADQTRSALERTLEATSGEMGRVHDNATVQRERFETALGALEEAVCMVDADWKITPAWLALFKRFPDRILVGGDEFISGGAGRRMPQSFEETWQIMDQLPKALREKIGRSNAARVYNL